MASSNFSKSIVAAANVLYKRLLINVSGGKYPKEIKDSMEIDTPKSFENSVSIEIFTTELGAVLSRVYELGSGLFGSDGKKYRIEPKDGGDLLHFEWKDAASIAPGRPEGTVAKQIVNDKAEAFLPYVMHPGIKPKPFIQKSIDESMDDVLEIVGEDFLQSVDNMLGPDKVVIQ